MDSAPEIALIGTGNWGKNILRDLVALGCSVHVVARSEGSIANAHSHGAATISSSVADLPRVDGAIAATITSEHAETIELLAARTDGPIFSEKPLTDDLAAAERLAAALGDRLFIMDKWRYHPGILELARIAQSNELGELRSIQTRRVTNLHRHPDVNTIWTHAPHDLSIGLEILGELPDVVFASGEYMAGEIVGINATLGRDPWLQLEISTEAPALRRETRIVCSNGSALLDGGWAETVSVRRAGETEAEIRPTPGELPLLAELRMFVEHVGGGPPPKSSASEGVLAVRRITEMLALAGSLRKATV